MPHQCTNCSETFPDGSKEMLSGCPNCGHNTFQYIPEGADPDRVTDEAEPPDPPIDEDSVTGTVTRAASTVSEYVRGRTEADPDARSADADQPDDPSADEEGESPEDRAQASARTDVANVSDLSQPSPSERTDRAAASEERSDSGDQPPREDARVVEEPEDTVDADLEDLRAELNDQFESIRIVEPGQYELNLMELYDREEHIVALREDGKYVIEVPETWRDDEDA